MQRLIDRSLELVIFSVLLGVHVRAEPIKVLHRQGAAHGFVAVKNLQNLRLATGDITQTVRGDRVTSRLVLRFRDGSLDDDAPCLLSEEFFV